MFYCIPVRKYSAQLDTPVKNEDWPACKQDGFPIMYT